MCACVFTNKVKLAIYKYYKTLFSEYQKSLVQNVSVRKYHFNIHLFMPCSICHNDANMCYFYLAFV